DLRLKVSAPSPDYFFSILRDSVEELISRRWPGLSYRLFVPCPTLNSDGSRCGGLFNFEDLDSRRREQIMKIECHKCAERHDVTLLLTGFGALTLPQSQELALLERVAAGVDRIQGRIERSDRREAEIALQVRKVLKLVSTEIIDCRRLFTVEPVKRDWRKMRFWD